MAEKSLEQEKKYLYPTVIATVTACSIMLFRIMGIVMVFNPLLLGTLLIPIVAMIVTSVGILWWLWRKSQQTHDTTVVSHEVKESPFRIGPALKFAGFVVLIKFASTLALVYQDVFQQLTHSLTQLVPFLGGIFHHLPIYLVSLFSGLADVDAITQEMSELSDGV